MLKNPRFTALALLMLTMAIGAGTLVFRVLTLHPRTNSVDLDSLQKRLRAAEIPSLHSVLVIQHDQMIVEWYFEGADEDRGTGFTRGDALIIRVKTEDPEISLVRDEDQIRTEASSTSAGVPT